MSIELRKGHCHICGNWTALKGCTHYGPQDYDLNKDIIDNIVSSVHETKKVVETSDFYQGINATLIYLRQNNLLK